MDTIRLITNDLYAPHPCVMSEREFYDSCEANGWQDCHFGDAGPVVASEADFDDLADACRNECIQQFHAIHDAEFDQGMADFAGSGSAPPAGLTEEAIVAAGLDMEALASACAVDDARVRAALPAGEPITAELVRLTAEELWANDIREAMP